MSSNPPPASLVQRHLDWSHKQGRILTANGRANEYYAKEDFTEEELPHYFLRSGETHTVFRQFTQEEEQRDSPICGAWSRPLFCGTWEHSTWAEETVYNVQTRSLFVDLRIPTTRSGVLPSGVTSLSSLSNEELRYYARQHVFAGFSCVTTEPDDDRPVCVRHHCIDWNYVGVPRSRPNKWWIETPKTTTTNEGTAPPPPPMWKEWAYAVDENKQHYYMERWERLENGGGNPGCLRIALRKCPSEGDPDGVLVVVGDHFNYVLGRTLSKEGNDKESSSSSSSSSSLVDLVDAALQKGDRETAERYCGIDAGHGRVSEGWRIDAAVQPWKEGTVLWCPNNDVKVIQGTTLQDCRIVWNGTAWNVYECSLDSVEKLQQILGNRKRNRTTKD